MMFDNSAHSHGGNPKVFCVGASAGGVSAMSYLVSQLPANFPCPVVLILHRVRKNNGNPQNGHMFHEILQAESKMPVRIVDSEMGLEAGVVYIPPYNRHIGVKNNNLVPLEQPDDLIWRPCVDVSFDAIANAFEDRVIGVLLTGGLDDGVEGFRTICRRGGLTIAQSPEDAFDPVLPLNAVEKDHPSYVTSMDAMPAVFCELAGLKHFPDQEQHLQKAAVSAVQLNELLS